MTCTVIAKPGERLLVSDFCHVSKQCYHSHSTTVQCCHDDLSDKALSHQQHNTTQTEPVLWNNIHNKERQCIPIYTELLSVDRFHHPIVFIGSPAIASYSSTKVMYLWREKTGIRHANLGVNIHKRTHVRSTTPIQVHIPTLAIKPHLGVPQATMECSSLYAIKGL